MLKHSKYDITLDANQLNSFPVRSVVLGNIWRLHAVSMFLKESEKESFDEDKIEQIVQALKYAK